MVGGQRVSCIETHTHTHTFKHTLSALDDDNKGI